MPLDDQALDMASMGQRFDQLSSTTRAAWTMVAHERPNRAQRQVYTFQQVEPRTAAAVPQRVVL
jgi:hypothetical protein